MKKINILLTIVTLLFIGTSCADLEVQNEYGADKARALSNGDDLYGSVGSAMNTIWLGIQNYNGLALGMATAADQLTCSWGNAGMRDNAYEPRIPYNNTASYAYASNNEEIWSDLYSALDKANAALIGLANGAMAGDNGSDNAVTEAYGYFIQGMCNGYLALTYDQMYVIDETTDLGNLVISDYTAGITSAVASMDKAIALCANNTFTLGATWIPGQTYTNVELAALANTMAARFLVYGSRTAAHNTAVNWATVLAYANNGITMDFAPEGDDQIWYSDYKWVWCNDGWGQVDMRIINLMDPNMPAHFPASGDITELPNDGQATTNDARLASDFTYKASCPFRPNRGYYHFSSYKLARYDYHTNELVGPMPEIFAYENTLLRAEAMVRTGDIASAVGLINAGNRITRGQLAEVTAGTEAEMLKVIFYEREIDLIASGYGLGWFDMRRRDMLQAGTVLSYPIPASQLEVLQMDVYTFGGADNADGVNTSNGGWF